MKHLICLVVLVAAARVESCGIAKPMKDMEPIKAMGSWRITHIKTPFEDERAARCLAVNMYANSDGNLFTHMTGTNDINILAAVIPQETGMLKVEWRDGVDYFFAFTNTDYENYAIGIACKSGDTPESPSYVMFMSREPPMSEDTVQMLKKEVTNMGIDLTGMVDLDQKDC